MSVLPIRTIESVKSFANAAGGSNCRREARRSARRETQTAVSSTEGPEHWHRCEGKAGDGASAAELVSLGSETLSGFRSAAGDLACILVSVLWPAHRPGSNKNSLRTTAVRNAGDGCDLTTNGMHLGVSLLAGASLSRNVYAISLMARRHPCEQHAATSEQSHQVKVKRRFNQSEPDPTRGSHSDLKLLPSHERYVLAVYVEDINGHGLGSSAFGNHSTISRSCLAILSRADAMLGGQYVMDEIDSPFTPLYRFSLREL